MLEVEILRMFLAVAEEGSIHGGARRLGHAQPVVSRALKKLERQVATELLVRSHAGITLTPSGEELLNHARAIVDRLDRVPELVRRAGRNVTSLTIGVIAGPVAAAQLTEAIIAAYIENVPSVEITVRELGFSNQFSAVEDEEVDIALVRPPYEGSALSVDPLFGEPVVLCLRADHPMARHDRIPVEGVLELPMVEMVGPPGSWNNFWLLRRQRGHAPEVFRRPVNTMVELRHAMMTTGGVMPISQGAAAYVATAPMVALPLDGAPLSLAAIAVRSGETREWVLEFKETAKSVTRQFVHRIDGGELLT